MNEVGKTSNLGIINCIGKENLEWNYTLLYEKNKVAKILSTI